MNVIDNIEDLNFLIYNNRSVELVKHFLPLVNITDFLILEKKFIFIQSLYDNYYKHEINLNDYDISTDKNDIIFDKTELEYTSKYFECDEIKNTKEYEYLKNRNIKDDIIKKYKLKFVSSLNLSEKELDIMGISLHPMLCNIFNEQKEFGILFPFFENDKLVNIATRRLENGPIKYSLAIPEISVYNIDKIKDNSEVWITEGLFDLFTLEQFNLNVVSVSSAMWSSIQLYQLINKKPKLVNIFSDYDYTGLRTSQILKRILNMYNIPVKIYVSNSCKDPSEHFIEKKLSWNDVEEIAITNDLLEFLIPDEKEKLNDYVNYLKNKTFI
jgi:hypothetical protein